MCDAVSKSHQITSRYRAFIDVVGALYHVALHQNRNAVFIWSVEMWFIFVKKLNVVIMQPFTKQLFCVTALYTHRIGGNPELSRESTNADR